MKNNDKISVLFIRDANSSNISFKISYTLLRFFILLFIVFFISFTAFVVYYGRITTKFIFISNILEENKKLKSKVDKINVLYSEISKIKAFEKKIKILTMNEDSSIDSLHRAIDMSSKNKEAKLIEKEIDEFVQNIKLHRNLSYMNIKDSILKRKKLLRSLPNILPVDGWISRGFQPPNNNTRRGHMGIDIAAENNSPIKSAGPGIVTFAGWRNDFGKLLEIDHGYGFVSKYGHCSRIIVKKGDIVERSQTIAFVGSSGRSSAPHVHFEILKDGKQLDPLIFILK